MSNTGYPDNWEEIATSVKEAANWQCQKCGLIGIKPGEKKEDLIPRRAYIMQVHHWNRDPSDNRKENLVCLCSSCHLNYHTRGQSNVTPGQLALFPSEDYLNGFLS